MHLRHRRRQRLKQKRLPQALRHYRQRYGGKTLADRPEVKPPGNYEIDTIVGGGKMVLVALEKHSRKVFIAKCGNRTAAETTKQLKRLLSSLPVTTITTDNGTEFCGWRSMEQSLGCDVYYTDPHAPCRYRPPVPLSSDHPHFVTPRSLIAPCRHRHIT